MVAANELTATQALGLMRAGQLSVEEMAQATLARIHDRDPAVKGWVHLDPDLILRNARELDKREIKGPSARHSHRGEGRHHDGRHADPA